MRSIFTSGLIILVAFGFISPAALPAAAQISPDAALSVPAQVDAAADEGDYVVLLPFPDLSSINQDRPLARAEARHAAGALVHEAAVPVRARLDELKARGQIESYRLQPDRLAYAVTSTSKLDASTLKAEVAKAGALDLQPAEKAAACGSPTLEDLTGVLFTTSHRLELRSASAETAPTILINYSHTSSFQSVTGFAEPGTAVSMRILRKGVVIAAKTTNSWEDGYYTFYRSYIGCGMYDWRLVYGDIVEITAGGASASTVFTYINGWADPAADRVSGYAAPSTNVSVVVLNQDSCSSLYSQKAGPVGANSLYQVDFSSQFDITNLAWVMASALDENGNGSVVGFSAYGLLHSFGSGEVRGYLKPGIAYAATLKRSGNIIETQSGITSPDNDFSLYFGFLAAGDVVTVAGGGATIQMTITEISAVFNHDTNALAGTAAPNRAIMAWFFPNNQVDFRGSCSSDLGCSTTFSSSTGLFSLNAGFDVQRGNYAYVAVFDAAGNLEYIESLHARVLIVHKSNAMIVGYWERPEADLVISLHDSANVKKEERSLNTGSGSSFGVWFSNTIEVSDKIIVTDTLTSQVDLVTVPPLVANLDPSTEYLNVLTPSGTVVAELYDLQPSTGEYFFRCEQAAVSGLGANIDFSSAQVSNSDHGRISLRDPGGHIHVIDFHAPQLRAVIDRGIFGGYTPFPNTTFQAQLWEAGSMIVAASVTSLSNGFFDITFPIDLEPGMQIKTNEAIPRALTIPNLTIQLDGAANRITGTAPASSPLNIALLRAWEGITRWTSTNASGSYSLSYDGFSYSYYSCNPVNVGDPCVYVDVALYTPVEDVISRSSPFPTGAAADAYESDDTPQTAVLYQGGSAHTFHLETDVDWIRFHAQAGLTLILRTTDLGPENDTILCLYESDGATEIACNDDYNGFASRIKWTPSISGEYLVKIMPYSWYNAAQCGSTYRFVIYRSEVFLPLLAR